MATGQRKQRSLRAGVRWSSLHISSAVKAPARKRRPIQGWQEAAETTRRPGTDPETEVASTPVTRDCKPRESQSQLRDTKRCSMDILA